MCMHTARVTCASYLQSIWNVELYMSTVKGIADVT